jgi:hypothetical protein
VFPNPGFQRQLIEFERKLLVQKKSNLQYAVGGTGLDNLDNGFGNSPLALYPR